MEKAGLPADEKSGLDSAGSLEGARRAARHAGACVLAALTCDGHGEVGTLVSCNTLKLAPVAGPGCTEHQVVMEPFAF